MSKEVNKALPLKLTKEEYLELVDCYGGLCLNCTELKYEGCEPDAEDYPCEGCDENRVQGIENALIAGHIEIVGE